MAHLSHSAVADLRQAIQDGRSTMIVGPARSGTTWLVNQHAPLGLEHVCRISYRGVGSEESGRSVVIEPLRLSHTPERPSDLQLALAGIPAASRPRLIVVNDCHLASPEAFRWLVQAALEPVAGVGRAAIPFAFEGAFDPDAALASAFPAGAATLPLIQYVEPYLPWRTLSEVDEIVRQRWRASFSVALTPWLADVSGGDVSFVTEILERLPNEGEIRDETLNAAVRQVLTNGRRAREIREATRVIQNQDPTLLLAAVNGQAIPAVVPSVLESSALKEAYFAGIVVYDGIAHQYRVRGPLTCSLVAEMIAPCSPRAVSSHFILTQLLIYFAHIASFELDVRRALQTRSPRTLAAAVSTETGLGGYRRQVMDAIISVLSPGKETLVPLSDSIKKILPDSKPLLDHIGNRIGVSNEESLLSALSFSQLVQLAQKAGLFGDGNDPLLREIGEYRNAFAHFRQETFGRCRRLLDAIAQGRNLLSEKHCER